MALDRVLNFGDRPRTEDEVRRARRADGRLDNGTWLPWDRDEESPMYIDWEKVKETIR